MWAEKRPLYLEMGGGRIIFPKQNQKLDKLMLGNKIANILRERVFSCVKEVCAGPTVEEDKAPLYDSLFVPGDSELFKVNLFIVILEWVCLQLTNITSHCKPFLLSYFLSFLP